MGMTMNHVPNRVQAGVPTGGQFARLERAESSLTLQAPAAQNGDGTMVARGLDFVRGMLDGHRARAVDKDPRNRSRNAKRAKVAVASLVLAAAAITVASGFSTSDDTQCQPAPAAMGSSYTATTASYGTAPAIFSPPIIPHVGSSQPSGSHLRVYWNLPGQPRDGDIIQAAQCAAPGTLSNS